MKTDVITIRSDLDGSDLALMTAEKFSEYHDITGKDAMHLRLLTEEAVSMIHGILDDFRGKFWMESEKTKRGLLCRICLSAEKQINSEQESQILSVATSGKNESARGIVGKIRELLRRSLQPSSDDEALAIQNMADAWLQTGSSNSGFAAPGAAFWSLQIYRQNLAEKTGSPERDELEKSIIAKIADEVKVWLRSDATEIAIEKTVSAG